MAKQTEEDKTLYRINKRFLKGIVDYGLINDGDKILVGLSGGKDSMALLELLAMRSRIFKPRFSVMAVHVEMSNIEYKSDTTYLREFAESLGVEFVTYTTSFDPTTDTRKSPCFLCSWNRRKALFTVAKEHAANQKSPSCPRQKIRKCFFAHKLNIIFECCCRAAVFCNISAYQKK